MNNRHEKWKNENRTATFDGFCRSCRKKSIPFLKIINRELIVEEKVLAGRWFGIAPLIKRLLQEIYCFGRVVFPYHLHQAIIIWLKARSAAQSQHREQEVSRSRVIISAETPVKNLNFRSQFVDALCSRSRVEDSENLLAAIGAFKALCESVN